MIILTSLRRFAAPNRDRMLAGEIWGSLGMMAAGVDPDRPMLGVRMNESDGNVIVDKVYSNSPAQRAGIMDGDQILRIGGIEAGQMIFWHFG